MSYTGFEMTGFSDLATDITQRIEHKGWLYKLTAKGSEQKWKRYYFVLLPDRLCYYRGDPSNQHGESFDESGPLGRPKLKYLTLDQFPVRSLPAWPRSSKRPSRSPRAPNDDNSYRPASEPGSPRASPMRGASPFRASTPHTPSRIHDLAPGASSALTRSQPSRGDRHGKRQGDPRAPIEQVRHSMFPRRPGARDESDHGDWDDSATFKGCVFSVTCGSHTFFLAADSPDEATLWRKKLTEAWRRCALHAIRGADSRDVMTHSLIDHLPPPPPDTRPTHVPKTPVRQGVRYHIQVETGSRDGAGTSANVFVEMMGGDKSSGSVHLKATLSGKEPFHTGAIDEFEVELERDLGDLRALRVWHDSFGRDPHWFLESITIRNQHTGQTWHFRCSRWLSRTRGESLLTSAELFPWAHMESLSSPIEPRPLFPRHPPLPRMQMESGERFQYEVAFQTRDAQGARWDSDVTIQMEGARGLVGRRHVIEPPPRGFDRGTATQRVVVEMSHLGDLEWLHVSLGKGRATQKWNLEVIVVTDLKTRRRYIFRPKRTPMLAGSSERIPVTLQGGRGSKTYEVIVHTHEDAGSSTTSDVCIRMIGADGHSTPEIELPAQEGDFSRGRPPARFRLDNVDDVGELSKLVVRINGMGRNPDWKLEKIVVIDRTPGAGNREYVFFCGRSFRKKDGTMTRTLPEEPLEDQSEYRITVVTQNKRGAGTDGEVSLTLHSGRESAGPLRLDDSTGRLFERGSSDSFVRKTRRIGPLDAITVDLALFGKHGQWMLQEIIIFHVALGREFRFVFNGVFSPPDKLSHRIPLWTGGGGEQQATYSVEVMTASHTRQATTTSAVDLVIQGEKGKTGCLELVKTVDGQIPFKMGQVDRFQLDSRAVWRMERIVISVDGMGEHPTWIPQYVHIVERVSGDVVDDAWFVNPGTRLGPDGKSVTLERGKPWHEERGKQRYKIRVKTGDAPNAGTSALVVIALDGTKGRSGGIELDSPSPGAFGPGQVDDFERELVDLGNLQWCTVGIRADSLDASWQLDWIEVTSITTGQRWIFHHGGWLGQGGKSEVRIPEGDQTTYEMCFETTSGTSSGVYVNLIGDQGQTGVKQVAHLEGFEGCTTRCCQVKSQTTVGVPKRLVVGIDPSRGNGNWQLFKVTVKSPRLPREYVFWADTDEHCDGWLGKGARDGKSERTLTEGVRDPNSASYTFEVTTADETGAGARNVVVYVKLRGTAGETRWLELSRPGLQGFPTGSTQEFHNVYGKDVGTMQRMYVKMKPAPNADPAEVDDSWHLDFIKATHRGTLKTKSHTRWFYLREWLPPNQEREMLARDGPLPKREAKPSHVIHVQTETGPRPGADVLPDSVSISIQGDRAQTDFATLRADPGTVPFRVGAIDHFKVPHQDVGEPQFVHVQVDSGSAAEGEILTWQVIKIILTFPNGSRYVFVPRVRGFDLGVVRSGPGGEIRLEREGANTYEVAIRTGVKNQRSPTAITVKVVGEGNVATGVHAPQRALDLRPNFPYQFAFKDPALVRGMRELHMQLRGPIQWDLEDVTVTCMTTGETAVFVPYPKGPLATDKQAAEVVLRLQRPYEPEPEPQPVELLMPPPQPTPELPVHFAVVTGPEAPQDVGEALNFTLFSERMPNGSGWLVASRENHVGSSPSTSMLFGPGQTDRFRLTSRQEMGELQRMLVWMWSRRPIRWSLREIVVSHVVNGQLITQRFPCEAILDSVRDQDNIYHAQIVLDKETQTMQEEPKISGYKVAFKTARRWFAGTAAQVHFELVGDRGVSGLILPRMKGVSFKSGSVDEYEFPGLRYLGELKQLRLGHNGKGLFSGWCPQEVVVTEHREDGNPGKTWLFHINKWVDRNVNNQIFVPAEEGVAAPHWAHPVATGTWEDKDSTDGEMTPRGGGRRGQEGARTGRKGKGSGKEKAKGGQRGMGAQGTPKKDLRGVLR